MAYKKPDYIVVKCTKCNGKGEVTEPRCPNDPDEYLPKKIINILGVEKKESKDIAKVRLSLEVEDKSGTRFPVKRLCDVEAVYE